MKDQGKKPFIFPGPVVNVNASDTGYEWMSYTAPPPLRMKNGLPDIEVLTWEERWILQ